MSSLFSLRRLMRSLNGVVLLAGVLWCLSGCSASSDGPQNDRRAEPSIPRSASLPVEPTQSDHSTTSTDLANDSLSEPTPAVDASPTRAANEPSDSSHTPPDRKGASDHPTSEPSPKAAPTQPQLPRVVMSEEHRASCRVFVGDRLPEATLVDTNGQSRAVSELLGHRGTIVVFWKADNPYSVAALEEIAARIVQPLEDAGIELLAINVGDTPEVVSQTGETLGLTGILLLDTQGEYFSQLATAYLPRIYFVDPDGTIAWLDIEYSRTTFRQLQQVVRHALGQSRTARRSPLLLTPSR